MPRSQRILFHFCVPDLNCWGQGCFHVEPLVMCQETLPSITPCYLLRYEIIQGASQ